jgi:para-nitrobenzyl esterase
VERTLSEAELHQRVAAVAGAETDAPLAAYNRAMPKTSPADRLIAALTGSNFWVRTVLLAERYAARGRHAPVYVYSLDWQSPAYGSRMKAHHAMDLPFVFDNVDVPDTTARALDARELAARVSATWIAFARHGSPENPGIPPWPQYTSPDRATMIFDTECGITRDPEARELWTRVVQG